MPSPLKIALVALLCTPLLAAGLLLAVLGTDTGTRMLARQAERWLGDGLTWDQLEGSLLGALQLRGVRVALPDAAVEIQQLSLDWQPRALLTARLQVERLQATGVRVWLAASDQPPPPSPPFRPDELPLPLAVWIQQLQVQDLHLHVAGQGEQLIDTIELQARLEQRELSLSRLSLRTPRGGVSGKASLALRNSMPLAVTMAWDWQLPATGGTASAGTPLAGELSADGSLQWAEPLAFDLDYRLAGRQLTGLLAELPMELTATGTLRGKMQGDELALERLSLAVADTPLALAIDGTATLPASAEPAFDGRLQWRGLQWPLRAAEPELASPRGQLALNGTLAAYDLQLAVSLAGSALPAGEWQGEARGDLATLQLQSLRGELLNGGLSVSGPLHWDPVPRWDLRVTGTAIDPGQWLPELPGNLAFTLQSAGRIEPGEGPLATLTVEQLAGTLLGYELAMDARAELAGDNLALQRLQLDSGGNRLSANGRLSPARLDVDWRLQAPNPDSLLPGARGRIAATGQLQGSPAAPRIDARLQAAELAFDDLVMEHLEAQLTAGLGAGDPLQLLLRLGPLASGDQAMLQAASLSADGTLARHQLSVDLQAAADSGQLRLEGGLDQSHSQWRGQLTALAAVTAKFGHWQLAAPAGLALSAGAAELDETCLQPTTGESTLCAQGEWHETAGGKLAVALANLPVARLLPELGGTLNAEITAGLAGDGALQASGAVELSPGQVRVATAEGTRELGHGGGELALAVDADGLAAELTMRAPAQGIIEASVQLPALSRFPLSETQPLAGRARAELPDLSGLPAWVPELAASAGRLHADLQLAGSLEQPQILGELALSNGSADIPMAGLQLRQIELRAHSADAQGGRLNIDGGFVSGSGQVTVEGDLDLTREVLALSVSGDRLQVYNTPDARVVASPALQVGWQDEILSLRGRVLVPEADITPQIGLSPGLNTDEPEASEGPGQFIAPSPDVVILGAGDEHGVTRQPASPVRLDSEVELVFGERVTVNAMGFSSRIAGGVTFRNRPGDKAPLPRAVGRLTIEDGTFRAFGQDLDIETGQLIFSGGPVTEPELNVRAVRWIDSDPQVTAAGVVVTGPASEPRLELFSRPQLEYTEIQSYLLTGHSAGSSENVLSIGTYLRPKFYVGYGYNLLEKTSEFNSLYTITPRYGVSGNFGEADSNLNLTFTHEH